jgi:4-hydroxybenzoate polyprenyltransferase
MKKTTWVYTVSYTIAIVLFGCIFCIDHYSHLSKTLCMLMIAFICFLLGGPTFYEFINLPGDWKGDNPSPTSLGKATVLIIAGLVSLASLLPY